MCTTVCAEIKYQLQLYVCTYIIAMVDINETRTKTITIRWSTKRAAKVVIFHNFMQLILFRTSFPFNTLLNEIPSTFYHHSPSLIVNAIYINANICVYVAICKRMTYVMETCNRKVTPLSGILNGEANE